jgi:hypothetical protein
MKAFSYIGCWLLLAVLAGHSAAAQEMVPHLKFGKPVQEELTMTTYAPDTTAAAVVLCSLTDVYYRWGYEDFVLVNKHKVRIKVLKPEGVDQANVAIPFYKPIESSGKSKEFITGLNAVAYNIEDGKVVATKMKKDAVFEERLNNSYVQLKFTVPQVKTGTLLEYEYEQQSDYYYDIDSWKAQTTIPVFYTEYKVSIPEYFEFNMGNTGWQRLSITKNSTNASFILPGGYNLTCRADETSFKGNKLAAIKADAYMWCPDDYCTQVNMELRAIRIPEAAYYRSFSQSWRNIENSLLNSESFGGRLRMSNPLKEEMEALNIPADATVPDKVTALFRLLKQRVKWNGSYALFGESSRKVLKEGTGTNADINFILMSMLNDADIPTYPILMSRRDLGRLPYGRPTLRKLNTFVVGVRANDSTVVYIDASVPSGKVDHLPAVLLTERARLMRPDGREIWVNLMKSSHNLLKVLVSAEISPEGLMTATRQSQYGGLYATELQRSYRAATDSLAYIDRLNTDKDIRVTALAWEGEAGIDEATVVEKMAFERTCQFTDDLIYINPLIFLNYKSNPFKQVERRLPVEFSHPINIQHVVSLKLPEGYVIDELPQSQLLQFSDKSITCRYRISKHGNNVILRYDFSLARTLYQPDEYPELQEFWTKMVEHDNSLLVLKKAEAFFGG